MADSRIEKWRRWLEQNIRPEVLSLHWYRLLYREVGEIVEANPDLPPSHFFTYVSETYAQTQAVAIRRQVEAGTRVISLGALMEEMASDSSRLTRKFYVSMYDEHTRELGDPDFDRLAGPDAAHIPRSVLEADISTLRAATQPIKDYVDRHLAHRDRAALQTLPTHRELNVAIDAVGAAFDKCTGILLATSYATLEPVMHTDWKAVFRVPWITSRP